MLSRNLIPLVAETINSRPRSLGLARPAEQQIIKAFRYHLAQKLKTAVEITFVVSDSTQATLTIGYMPLEFREAAQSQKAAQEVIELIKERVKTNTRIQSTIAGIPNKGLLLLYEFDQAYEIATNLKIADFSTTQFAYTACLHFASSDKKDIDADKWFAVLCEFSDKCISNGSWRTALLCLDQAEHLLAHFFLTFDPDYQSREELVEALIRLGDCFVFADLPERAIALAKRYMPQLEELSDERSDTENIVQELDYNVLKWQKSSSEIWAENAPLIVIGRDFAKKIA